MAAYIIFEVDVKDPERYAQNRDLIQPILKPYGRRFLIRGGNVECLEGDRTAISGLPKALSERTASG